MRKPSEIAELRDKDRNPYAIPPHLVNPIVERLNQYADDDRDWYYLYAQREREQMERPMGVRSSDASFTGTLRPPPRFARPFPARAFLAFCVAGCFAWLGIVAAIRWWLG